MSMRSRTIRTAEGPVTITLEARDQHNDSVIFDHFIDVEYPNGRKARFDMGTDVVFAMGKYEEAVRLAGRYRVREVA